jgi:hypothetical protein
MSDPETKEKRSRRFLKSESIVEKRYRFIKSTNKGLKEKYETEKHRLCDSTGVNCGNSNCVMCSNPRKIFKEKTIQEQSFEQDRLWNYREPRDEDAL